MRHTAFIEPLDQLKYLKSTQRKQLRRQLASREPTPASCVTEPLPTPKGCPHCRVIDERLGP